MSCARSSDENRKRQWVYCMLKRSGQKAPGAASSQCESRGSSIRDRMRTVLVGTSPDAACVVVVTLTDEHSTLQSPLTARQLSQHFLGRRFFSPPCASCERAEAVVTAPLLIHHGQLCTGHVLAAGDELGGSREAAQAAYGSATTVSVAYCAEKT